MDLFLYNNISEKNKIGKTLLNEQEFTGNLRDGTSIINPTIYINTPIIGTKNYCYIVDFSRFYFIKDIIAVRTGLWAVMLSVDVLESFKDDIKDLSVILADTETLGTNNYLQSDVFLNNCKSFTDILNFSNGLLDNGEFILITAGG